MGSLRAALPWWKTAPLKRPIKPNFWPPPLHGEDPHPTRRYLDQNIWVWAPFACLKGEVSRRCMSGRGWGTKCQPRVFLTKVCVEQWMSAPLAHEPSLGRERPLLWLGRPRRNLYVSRVSKALTEVLLNILRMQGCKLKKTNHFRCLYTQLE